MATLKKGSKDLILRELSGSIGDVIISQRNGKTYIRSKPKYKKPSCSPRLIAAQKKFAAATLFSKFLRNIPLLQSAWKKSKADGTAALNKMIKANYHDLNCEEPGVNNTITPPHPHFRLKDVVLNDENIALIMEDWFETKPDDKLIIVLSLSDPAESSMPGFQLIDISPESPDDFTICFTEEQLETAKNYRRFILYTAVCRESGNTFQWSNTAAVEGMLNVE